MTSKNPNPFLFVICLAWLLPQMISTCSTENEERSKLPMNWTPVDSLNMTLPEDIRLYSGSNDSLPLRAWYVYIDERHPEIFTRTVVSDDTTDNREPVSSFARDLGACVVVNGGYFTMYRTPARHVGLLVSDGAILEHATNFVTRDSIRYEIARAAIGFSRDDDIDISWVSTRNDTLYSWPSPPQNKPGKPASRLRYQQARVWKVQDALAAGPALIVDGRIHITSDQEVFFGTSIPKTHPRTAIGYTAEGALIVMVVDGRQDRSRGVTLEELAILMRDLGVVEAMNLDGGGSSTLVVNNTLVNRPTGGTNEREVMSAIATFVKPKIGN
ncbi:MAG: phosphodiester glycosidase family protein [bacterium]